MRWALTDAACAPATQQLNRFPFVALILAVNPGNQHSPTLARLARELPGCELIGAESCDVAIKAIKKRVPDVLLLPAAAARGEANLIAHLKSVPGGVLTLKLPSVE